MGGDLTLKELAGYFWNQGLPLFMAAIWVYSGYKGWWVWGREKAASDVACDEWKGIAMETIQGLKLSTQATKTIVQQAQK